MQSQDINAPDIEMRLDEWQMFNNWFRPHSFLCGKSPTEKCHELSNQNPFWDDVEARYDPVNEPIREQHYRTDRQLSKLK